MNALVYGIPDSIALLQQYASTGVLTAFLTFPIYCFTILLFSSRSIPPSKRLVKRRYLASDVQFASERVREMERLSSMYPSLPPPARPPTNLQRPAKLPGTEFNLRFLDSQHQNYNFLPQRNLLLLNP